MEITLENFRNFDIRQIVAPNLVDKDEWIAVQNKIETIKPLIDEMLRILKTNSNVPEVFKGNVEIYANELIKFIEEFNAEIKGGQPIEVAKKKAELFFDFDRWYFNYVFSPSNGKEFGFFDTYNIIKNLEKINYQEEKIVIEELKQKLISDSASINTILKELQKKASKITMSDYAKIFGDESKKHNTASYIWLGAGIALAVLFFCLLLCTNWLNKFPTEDVSATGEFIKYNIGHLLVRLLIYAVLIFMISFAFRQFSIGRHLQTVNKHRQNGLDSFKLFVESISKDDKETRNNLRLQLAKAIYEQTSTGYISDKNQSINSGIVEITKMIGANKPN